MKPSILKNMSKSNKFVDFVRVGALAFIVSTLMIATAHALFVLKETVFG